MALTQRTLASATLCTLLVGFLLGIVFDAHYRPNQITFEVDRYTAKVNVVPKKNDIINWVMQGGDTPVTAGFLVTPPCNETTQPNSTCTINGLTGSFPYVCVSASCSDPGVDPRSTTNRLDTLESVKVFLHSGQNLTPPTAPPGTAPVVEKYASNTTPPAGIQCYPQTGAPIVNWEYTNPLNPADPWPVTVGQPLVWQSGSISSFTLDFPPGTCQETSINNNSPTCTVLNTANFPVTYHITTSGTGACTNNPGTATLALKK